jgi:hypothetical protein
MPDTVMVHRSRHSQHRHPDVMGRPVIILARCQISRRDHPKVPGSASRHCIRQPRESYATFLKWYKCNPPRFRDAGSTMTLVEAIQDAPLFATGIAGLALITAMASIAFQRKLARCRAAEVSCRWKPSWSRRIADRSRDISISTN